MRFKNLASGSTGNATVVEAGQGAGCRRLLVDCGLGLRQLTQRLAHAGLQASDLHGLFITHEHSDHIGCALGFSARHSLPVWMSEGTWLALGEPDLGDRLRLARDQVPIDFGPMALHPFTVPHDAREPLQLRCEDGVVRLGLLTDLGHVSPHVLQQLAGCHALLMEANHDADLLSQSRYPPFLKRRISGPWGHLENNSTAQALRQLQHPGLRQVVAAHLSEQNNQPALVQQRLGEALGWPPEQVGIASPVTGTDWISV
ncbi:MBL fold metallo-hydrolase [Curvibacter sp. HBC61]|uniref:MBL fold metallo-hydrolase n=1 Tax=Curvibacter cyanobacteriorum TaxID=3026422 RepID=A0ABT5MT32_9BURK|nr:MBL fold metallo-hydrolase [Curvibacter sp. HBC61]MDD0836983.1 MBL fold metallo-hydrolase [Curvibacter sp. HBC61]